MFAINIVYTDPNLERMVSSYASERTVGVGMLHRCKTKYYKEAYVKITLISTG